MDIVNNRQRSPIEMIVDKACGLDPSQPIKKADWELLTDVADAAIAWKADKTLSNVERLEAAIDALSGLGW